MSKNVHFYYRKSTILDILSSFIKRNVLISVLLQKISKFVPYIKKFYTDIHFCTVSIKRTVSKKGKGGKSVLLFFLFSLFSQNQENLFFCYQATYKSRKSVLKKQEYLFFTLTLCYSAQNHVLSFIEYMLYNFMFPTMTINKLGNQKTCKIYYVE